MRIFWGDHSGQSGSRRVGTRSRHALSRGQMPQRLCSRLHNPRSLVLPQQCIDHGSGSWSSSCSNSASMASSYPSE